MEVGDLWFTQRTLKRAYEIPKLVSLLHGDDFFKTPIELQICEDGEIEIVNGHHRIVAIYLAGRQLRREDYLIFLTERSKGRFWQVRDLKLKTNLLQSIVPSSNGRTQA